MSEKIFDLGRYIENPPCIFDILGEHYKTQYPNLQTFLITFHNKISPLLGDIVKILENLRSQIDDSQKLEKNNQILRALQELEKENLWAQFIELEAQKRAVLDLTQKLEGEISLNIAKEGEISSSLSIIRPQFQQKNDTVQYEFKKFRATNGELQQLFKDQNQILRKINQLETDLNNPKAKKTPDEISTIEKELLSLRANEEEIRQTLPQKQKELESQRLLHQQKDKEFRPLKVKFDGLVAEQVKLDHIIKTDKSRLDEKQKELSEISKKIQEFLKINNMDPKNRPATIRTKNIIEDKIKGIKVNLRPDSQVQLDAKSPAIENQIFLSSFEKLSGVLATVQSKPIQSEIRSLSKEIASLRNQFAPKFSNVMSGLNRKGGVQVGSLITSSGPLRFIENGKEKSIATLLAFLLTVYGDNAPQLKIDSHTLSPAQIDDLEGITKAFQSKTDLEFKIVEV